jgi:prefoldin subunit 5
VEFFVACFDRRTGLMTDESREFIKRRCDYTLEEITAARNKIAELENQISSLRSSIAEFTP